MMERWKGSVALVTGASAGIGAALVKELVKHGMKVAACARDKDRLKILKESLAEGPGEVLPIRCDVSKEHDVIQMYDVIRRTYGRLDFLVNNAGMSRVATLLEGSTEHWREMREINVLGPCMCTREGFKLMDEGGRKDCHIINISSMSGHRLVMPPTNYYGMTKTALNAHTEGVRRELREKGSSYKVSKCLHGNSVDTKPETQLQTTGKILAADNIVDACIYILATPPHVQVHDIMVRPTHQIS